MREVRERALRCLLDEDTIEGRVSELAAEVSRDLEVRELLCVGILKGAFIFMSDLVRRITVPVVLDFMSVSSYGPATESSGVVRILKDLEESIEGRHVIVVDDIVDTGLTLNYLRGNLWARRPASLRACVLLDKPERRVVDVPVEYTGFRIPDEYVVGYGLDQAERYRHLPYVAAISEPGS